jgi:hypothetical protein
MVVLAVPRQDFVDQTHGMDSIEVREHHNAGLSSRMAPAGLGFQDIAVAVTARHPDDFSHQCLDVFLNQIDKFIDLFAFMARRFYIHPGLDSRPNFLRIDGRLIRRPFVHSQFASQC